jgi:predicted metal-dependent HD superfamily phosphohydrolase
MTSQPNFHLAHMYAADLLTRELPEHFVYHSLWHTESEVLASVERLAAMTGIEKHSLALLQTAAWFHDVGCVVQRHEHEAIGMGIARAALPGFGYQPQHIRAIGRMIWATRLPQTPDTLCEQILADSDLDVLGRDDFLDRNRVLREELALMGQQFNDPEWYRGQIKLMLGHSYFTAAASALRTAQKRRNIEVLQELLCEAEYMDGS